MKMKMKTTWRYCEFVHFVVEPKEGDIVERKMESGKIGVFRIENIDIPTDPGDQFFYDENFLGYKGDKIGFMFKKELPQATRKANGFLM